MKFVLRLKIYFSLRTICFEQCVSYLLVYCLLTVTDSVYYCDQFVFDLRAVFDFEHR